VMIPGGWEAMATQRSLDLSMVILNKTIMTVAKMCLLTTAIVVFMVVLVVRYPLPL